MTEKYEEIKIRKKVKKSYSHINYDLLIDFFIIFSRFEYALKAAGFIPDKTSKSKVSWDKFKNKIKDKFCLKSVKHPSSMPLFENFKTQVVLNGKLQWRDFEINQKNSDADNIIDIVKTIRNNLFHSAKNSEYCTGANKNRDEKLILYALKAIEELIDSEKDVKYHFYNTL